MNYLFAIFMAVIAYSCISTGFVLQKLGIDWLGWKGEKNRAYFKNLSLWIAGFIIMNIYGVPSAVALKQLPPHIVAAFAGWGIIVLVFLSHFLLKEKLFKTDYFFSLLVVAGIVLLNVFERPTEKQSVDITGMIILCALPIILFFLGFIKKFSNKFKTIIYAAVAGSSAGLLVVTLRMLVLKYQYKIALYFNSPYLYLYILFAILALIALQIAFKNGPMMTIGPLQYSSNIIYPLFATLLVFHQLIHIAQFAAIALIVYSVSKILQKR